jgi:hypothetical protein
VRGLARLNQESRIVARVHHLYLAGLRVQPEEDRRHIPPPRFFALGPVVLVHPRRQLVQRHSRHRHRPEGRAEAGGHDGRSQPLARYVCHRHQQAAVRLLHNIQVIAAQLIAGNGAEAHRVSRDRRQPLRQQRLLNRPPRIQVLLHSRELDVALVVPRIFQSHRGLQREPFDKVRLVNCQLPPVRRRHHQLSHPPAVAILQRIAQRRTRVDRRLVAINQPGGRKRRPVHLQLSHHDPQHLLQHFFLANRRVNLPRSLQQRLQPRHLLLQVDRLAVTRDLHPSRHPSYPPWILTLSRQQHPYLVSRFMELKWLKLEAWR